MEKIILVCPDVDDERSDWDEDGYITKQNIQGTFSITELIGRTIEGIEEDGCGGLRITLTDKE